jgi:hypothetical protein
VNSEACAGSVIGAALHARVNSTDLAASRSRTGVRAAPVAPAALPVWGAAKPSTSRRVVSSVTISSARVASGPFAPAAARRLQLASVSAGRRTASVSASTAGERDMATGLTGSAATLKRTRR